MGATEHARAGALIDGKYRVEEVIGAGGMGVVVAAHHVTLGTRVAVKLVRPACTREPGVAIARFEREARIASRLQSEHVARVEDMGTLPDGTPYMVMDRLEGQDLRRLLAARGPLPIGDCIEYVRQACLGVAEAHAAGIVHRDLNPSNLFLARRPDGSSLVKVLDFGIARLTHDVSSPSLTASALLLGSVHYMSPEQMRSARTVDVRSDVWSLGAILHELVTGAPAFAGETMPETCAAVIFRPARPLAELRPDAPPRLQSIVSMCLAKRREDRYADVEALIFDLAKLTRELDVGSMDTMRAAPSSSFLPSVATPSSYPRGSPPSRSDVPVAITPPRGQTIRRRKRSWWAWIAGAEAVALLIVVGAFVTQARTRSHGSLAGEARPGDGKAASVPGPSVVALVPAVAPPLAAAVPPLAAPPALARQPGDAAKVRVAPANDATTATVLASPRASASIDAPAASAAVDAGSPHTTGTEAPTPWQWGDRK